MASGEGVPLLFLLLGLSLIAGYAGHLLFRHHRVSDILFLLGVGLVAGPVLGIVDATLLRPAFLILAPMGLAIVLFEGGLELAWEEIRKYAARAFGFSMTVWTLTTATMWVAGAYILGLSPALALLFAVIVSATGILAVIPLLQQMKAPAEARVLLTVETSVGDLVSAVATVAIASALVLGASPMHGFTLFGAKVLVGASVGLIAGLIGARLLHHLEADRHAYAVTLGALLVAYAIAEGLGGSGFLTALVLGLVMGNASQLVRLGGLTKLAPLPATMRLQQSSIIFILRSVYFVFLGLSVSPDVLTLPYVLAGLAIAGLMLGARILGVLLSDRRRAPHERGDRMLLVAMMPRGLAAAVLATVPAAMGVPGSEVLVTYAFLAIVGADIVTTIGLALHERLRKDEPTASGAVAH